MDARWKGNDCGGLECLSAVRTLHKTVVGLRTALEHSKGELQAIKSKALPKKKYAKYFDAIEKLSLENHVLRRKILSKKPVMDEEQKLGRNVEEKASAKSDGDENINDSGEDKATQPNEELTAKTDSEGSEVDDIELIFTTELTKDACVQGDLEPISDEGEPFTSFESTAESGVLTHSVLVETDISKCGVVGDQESFQAPIIREVMASSAKRPSLGNALRPPVIITTGSSVRDSEAQTDISAVPQFWKSESYLASAGKSIGQRKFPTLPSKFVPPVDTPKTAEKTREARRVLLSDINFTSMVPELSRSVDHLCHSEVLSLPPDSAGLKVVTPSRNPLSPVRDAAENKIVDRKMSDPHFFRRLVSRTSLDMMYTNRTESVPPSPTQRRYTSVMPGMHRVSFESQLCPFMSRYGSQRTPPSMSKPKFTYKPKTKISFDGSMGKRSGPFRQSLPNLYVDSESGGESTDSLLDDAEKHLAALLTSLPEDQFSGYQYRGRTFSDPNLSIVFAPPSTTMPFIARTASDLRVDNFVKVINKDGRVVGGRVQYIGELLTNPEPHVGILLPRGMGDTDGSIGEHRYFVCDKNRGLFVPFRKVVMAWKECK